jgi:hypothetical protein
MKKPGRHINSIFPFSYLAMKTTPPFMQAFNKSSEDKERIKEN